MFLCLETDVHVMELPREDRLAIFSAHVLLHVTVQHTRAAAAMFPSHEAADRTHKYREHHVLLGNDEEVRERITIMHQVREEKKEKKLEVAFIKPY